MLECTTLKDLMKRNGGLLQTKSKFEIRSLTSLSMIYTPGVGHVSEVIKQDKDQAIYLTNKANSMLVLSDSSGFVNYEKSKWKNDYVWPYLEAKCVYYKTFTNIDAYPLIVDHKKLNSAAELFEL